MVNQIVIVGRLTASPELKHSASGTAIGTFTVACDRQYQKDGNKEADFIPVVTFKTLAENCSKYLDKGRLAAVTGHLQIRNYTDKDGNKRKSAEIIADNVKFLDRAKDPTANMSMDTVPEVPFGKGSKSGDFAEISFDEDMLPF